MKGHFLKMQPVSFEAVISGDKTVELKINNKGVEVGDILLLRECVTSDQYTGRAAMVRITYILENVEYLRPKFQICCFELLEKIMVVV